MSSSSTQFRVPMSAPDITNKERAAVAAVLDTPTLSIGPNTEAFEAGVAAYTGRTNAIAVSSGTAGLHLCVRAAGIGAGDLAITTPFSFIASSNVLLFENAIPVFVDADPASGNLDLGQLKKAIEDLGAGGERKKKWLPRKGAENAGGLKGILPVDVFGQPLDMKAVIEVSAKHDLQVIEDACEAFGAQHERGQAGTLGQTGVFAFYPNKQMTTGEGGAIVTDDGEAANYMRGMRSQGRAPGDSWLQHTYLGYNYRMTEMSAALGCAQLERLDELLAKRERVAGWYEEHLGKTPGVQTPQVVAGTEKMSWFVYVIRLDAKIDRDALIERLAGAGIPSRPYFAPIHLQPFMVERFGYREGDFPITEELGRRSLALPFSSIMTEEQVKLVCDTLAKVL